jgi:hypothetical protein
MDKLRVLVCEPDKAPEVREIDDTLEAMQAIVGGYIQAIFVNMCKDYVLVCNEEGRLKGLEPNIYIGLDVIVGTCFFCNNGGEDFASLDDSDIEALKELLSAGL